jgi:hypothetical protein
MLCSDEYNQVLEWLMHAYNFQKNDRISLNYLMKEGTNKSMLKPG